LASQTVRQAVVAAVAALVVGQRIGTGERFASLGTADENGGWAPHLHFQLALLTEGLGIDWPGVADPDELAMWRAICPNPAALLNLPDAKTGHRPLDIAAISAGARQAEVTINGIGERAGNTSLEEVVMTLHTRPNFLPVTTGIRTDQIYPTSRLVSMITGIIVQPNKAIVGANAFAHEAGIHQDGVLKERLTYEIMTPQSIGLATNRLHLGKHSGRHALKQHLDELGYKLNEEELKDIFKRFKDLADRKKSIYDEDLDALMANMIHKKDEIYILEEVRVESGSHIQAKATITMTIKGKKVTEKLACGDGPVDAVFQAIRKLTDFHGTLVKFSINAVTGGADAQGEVMVAIEDEGRVERGVGSHTDIVVASGMAYVNALNRLVIKNRAVEAHL